MEGAPNIGGGVEGALNIRGDKRHTQYKVWGDGRRTQYKGYSKY